MHTIQTAVPEVAAPANPKEPESGAEPMAKRFSAYLHPNFTQQLVEHLHRAKIAALREKE